MKQKLMPLDGRFLVKNTADSRIGERQMWREGGNEGREVILLSDHPGESVFVLQYFSQTLHIFLSSPSGSRRDWWECRWPDLGHHT